MDKTSPAPSAQPPLGNPPLAGQPLAAILTFVLIVTVLYLGRGIFVPLVMAVLLAFALGPVVNALRRVKVPHVVAVIVSVLAVIGFLGSIAYLAFSQFLSLASDLPRYQATINEKLRLLQETFGGGRVIDRLVSTVDNLGAQMSGAAEDFSIDEGEPLPVVIVDNGMSSLETAQSVLFSIVGPLATALIATIFLIFLLLEREELRDRFLKLASRGDLRSSTEAMNEASTRVGRYLLAQASVNIAYGTLFGLGLFILGVPNAVLWGLLATIFRYIPFVGTIVIASVPILLSIAVDPGWTMLFGVIGLYLLLEVISNNFIEPRLYGNSTGLTPLAVLLAAMFWATLWGPIGLIVSMPLTVCIVVMARYVPHMGFIETLLGSAPVLLPRERFYQRLISGNVEEATELAEREIEESGIVDFYDDIAQPALQLAQADIAGDLADPSHRHRVVDTLAEVIEAIEETEETDQGDGIARVTVFGGKTELDHAMALMVGERIRAMGHKVRIMAPVALRKEGIAQIDLSATDVVCLCYLGEKPEIYARYAARRLTRLKETLTIVGAYFHTNARRSERNPDDQIVLATTVSGAVNAIASALGEETATPVVSESALVNLRMSARALSSQAAADPDVSTLLRKLAQDLGATVAMVTFVPLSDDREDGRVAAHAEHLAHQVLDGTGSLSIEDLQHSDFSHLRGVVESGVRAYAGVAVRLNDTDLGAVLAVYDQEPRVYEDSEIDRIEAGAQRLASELRELIARQEAQEKEAID
ncbi:AI-2E family transporter [Pelagibacterium luteolum]|uniref:Predicted PurR-regulated permease PerM n=1 Tax=Pelagibacterium luteolum TaxID=440168 RepID=A0A1G7WV93_9HYPH|nr:AI-2E family transporter [Pelagibacterium luteolum]SDG75829.1 Predicted PurR-regulated permease PerM [Pelagibacterium luteolum]